MILWGQNTPIMQVHRRKRDAKNIPVKDLLSTSREDIQKIKNKEDLHFSKIDTRSFTLEEKMVSTDQVWH